jgi:HK97 gp10 family phage protein
MPRSGGVISITDNHAPRLLRMAPAIVEPLIRDEVEAGVRLIAEEAQFSIRDGAVSGSAHVASLPGEAPNNDTGELADGIRVGEVTKEGGHIASYAESTADYAGYLERGTSRMAERPYMAPASRRSRGKIIRSLVDRLRKGRA